MYRVKQYTQVGFWLLFVSLFSIDTIQACTVVLAWDGDRIFVGNNEDWIDVNAKHWYEPSGKRARYGAVFFGFKKEGKYAQGGMNEEGLFFDGLFIEKVKLEKSTRTGKKAAPQHIFKQVLHNASTVEEALQLLEPYFIPFIKNVQIVIADRHGDYAVLNVNGITRRRLEKERYVLISNFPAEEMSPRTYEDPLYEKASKELENSNPITSSLIKKTLDICHQEGGVKSIYSNIFDLTNRRIENYYLYDFSEPHVIDLRERIHCEDNRTYLFTDIFPNRHAQVSAPKSEN